MVELHPGVKAALGKYGIEHEIIECRPELADTAAFCEHYGYAVDQAANTLLVASKKVEPTKYAVCVVLGTSRLDVNKKVCQLLGVKRASFANADETVNLTGMMIGGVVAIGTENLPIYIDASVMDQPRIIMGGGNRSSKLLLDPKELSKLPGAVVVANLAKPKNNSDL